MKRLDWIRIAFSVVGAFDCAAVVVLFGASQSGELWPAPGIYFLELIVLGLAGLVAAYQDKPGSSRDWGIIPWIVSGLLLAFVVLGGFSIGPFLIPAMLLFALAGGIADVQYKRSLLPRLIAWAMAAVFQAAILFLVISMVNS